MITFKDFITESNAEPVFKKLIGAVRKNNINSIRDYGDAGFYANLELKGDKMNTIGNKLKKAGFRDEGLEGSHADREAFGTHKIKYTKGNSWVSVAYNPSWKQTGVSMDIEYKDL